MRRKFFLLFALLCFTVSGVWADELQSFNTTQRKLVYENDYVKVRCNDRDYSNGMALGGTLFRYIWIESKHNTKIKKIEFTVTYTTSIDKLEVWGGSFTRDGQKVTVTPNSDNTTGNVTLYSKSTEYYLFVDHVDVYYEPTELAPNAAGEYPISSKKDWELFCSTVNSGKTTFSGKKVILTNDITEPVTTMVGEAIYQNNVFSGTFDGQGHTLTVNLESTENRCSPFRIVKGGTIQNLCVEGTIKCDNYSGGIIGATEGVVTLKNCNSAVDLSYIDPVSTVVGGLIGCVNSSSSLNVEGCIFSGKMKLSQTDTGGMVGRIFDNDNQNHPITFTNCLVAPSSLDIGSQSSSTFCNTTKPQNCTFNNCYYKNITTKDMGTHQGKEVYTIDAETFKNDGSVTLENVGTPATEYTVSGITAYASGIKYNDQFCAGKGDVLNLKLTPSDGYAISGVEVPQDISLSGDGNLYTLTMPEGKNVTITALLNVGYTVSSNDLVSGETTLVHFDTDHSNAIYTFGDKVTLTANLAPNVVINSVTLVPDADPTITKTATAVGNSQYQFDMPESNVTVTYDYYLDYGQNAYGITWTGGEGTTMLKQVGGINVVNANAGDVVTITLSDESNKLATSVTVTGMNTSDNVNVTRASVQDNVFTFVMPSEAVTVNAEFKSSIFMMTASHCTIEASVNGRASTFVDGFVGVTGADKDDVLTLTVTPTVAGEVISQTMLAYTPTGGESVSTYATKLDDTHFQFTMPDNVAVTVYPLTAYALSDDKDNSSFLEANNGRFLDVMLKDRTLYRDGKWNSLCLPFDLVKRDFDSSLGDKVPVGDTHPLDGATVMVLDSYELGKYDSDGHVSEGGEFHTGFDTQIGTLYLYFKTPETTESSDVVIPAGTPFIIKWDGEHMGEDIVDPTICGVTIDNVEDSVAIMGGAFVGSYSPVSITGEDKSILFLGGDDQLYYPSSAVNIGAFRAFIKLDGIQTDDPNAGVRQFVINFCDDETTTAVANSTLYTLHSALSSWYTLDGRRLSGKPTTKGLYINNGKVIIIK